MPHIESNHQTSMNLPEVLHGSAEKNQQSASTSGAVLCDSVQKAASSSRPADEKLQSRENNGIVRLLICMPCITSVKGKRAQSQESVASAMVPVVVPQTRSDRSSVRALPDAAISPQAISSLPRIVDRLPAIVADPQYARHAMVPTMLQAHPSRQQERAIVDWAHRQAFIEGGNARDHGAAPLSQQQQSLHLYGQEYALYGADDPRLEQLTEMPRLLADELPVYCERLSRHWHSAVCHTQPVFTGKEQALINKIKLAPDDHYLFTAVNNAFPEKYGQGRIYTVMRQQDVAIERMTLLVIEMNGELVPIRLANNDPSRYEAYSFDNPGRHGNLVEWDGARWIFDRSVTPQLSPSLHEKIVHHMALLAGQEAISAQALLAPDHHGIRWHRDHDNRGYLKVNGSLVPIARDERHRSAFSIPHAQGCIEVVYARGRLSLKDMTSMAHSSTLQNPRAVQRLSPDIQPIWQDAEQRDTATDALVSLGNKIKDSEHGPVFEDRDNAGSLIKRFNVDLELEPTALESSGQMHRRQLLRSERVMLACREAALFNRYYGNAAAEVLADDSHVYLKMLRPPGTPLAELRANSLPPDAAQRLSEMLTRLANCGVWRGDVQELGVQYCAKQGLFYPSDFSRTLSSYLDGMPSLSRAGDLQEKLTWQRAFDLIEAKRADARH